RRPLLKKSRTISVTDSTTPHFPGPLFPTVRRLSDDSLPPSSTATWPPRRSFDSSDSSTTSNSDSFSSQTFAFSDRDYVYPSFLGPNTTRNRLTVVKPSANKSLRKQPPVPSPVRTGSLRSKSIVSAEGSDVESVRKSSPVLELGSRSDRVVKPVPVQNPVTSLTSSSSLISSAPVRRTNRIRSSLMINLMVVLCLVIGCYAVVLRNEVTKLQVDSLRKGKSEVIESNHILVLGWSDKLGSLLKQLAIANKSIGGGVVVVLAERDKEEMEMDIAKLEFSFMGTSVICRSGSPLILADLKKVSVSKAKAIIVLAADENADQSDARALRVVLSLTGVKEGLRGHVVVEMSDLDNEPLVKLVGGELIETVVAHDVIGRLMIQCALQPGLAQIWEDILGFENAEFYIKRWPQLDGMRFEDVLISFPDAIPCGVKVASEGGKININPHDEYILKAGDEILVIAEDDDTYSPSPLPEVRRGIFPKKVDPPKFPEKILFCGWRRDIDDMIMVLEAFLAPGSELWMFNEVLEKERERKLVDGGLDISGLVNIKLVHRVGNAVIKKHLETLPLETFDSILILADESVEDSIVHSDSRSLATLLLIRDIQSKRLPSKDTSSTPRTVSSFSHSSWIREMQQASNKSIIISEILDSRTRNLVSVTKISDYVLSNELVSMALAMVAEDKQINRVLEELFAEEGNEMCIKPAEFYVYDQEEVCFYEIMIRGRERNEIVIGYRLATAERAIINPVDKDKLVKWSSDDVFVVIAFGE
ncbi:hypothetical protein M8C21_033812, partial [Ambrosia artemisiifolia]